MRFVGARLNLVDRYSPHHDQGPRSFGDENWRAARVPWSETARAVVACGNAARARVQPGDRVVAICQRAADDHRFLACASVGAVWSVCSPDMAVQLLDASADRTEVLIASDGYATAARSRARRGDRRDPRALPSVQHTIIVRCCARARRAALSISTLLDAESAVPRCCHTSRCRPIIRCGRTRPERPACPRRSFTPRRVLLEMLKGVHLHRDIGRRTFLLVTTRLDHWNVQVSGLLAGATRRTTGIRALPTLAPVALRRTRARTFFGAGPPSSPVASRRASSGKKSCGPGLAAYARINGIAAAARLPLGLRRGKARLWLVSIAGGTDLAGDFYGLPTLPVYRARCSAAAGAQGRGVGRSGRPLIDEVGELVCHRAVFRRCHFVSGTARQRYRES